MREIGEGSPQFQLPLVDKEASPRILEVRKNIGVDDDADIAVLAASKQERRETGEDSPAWRSILPDSFATLGRRGVKSAKTGRAPLEEHFARRAMAMAPCPL